MAGIDRTTIIAGPCQITYAGSTFYSKGDVTLKPVFDHFDIPTSAFGKADTRLKNRKWEVSFEPDGRMTSALIAILWPYGTTPLGSSVFGTPGALGTDRPLLIWGKDGVKVTLFNAALTQMPTIRIGVGVTMCGPCKFTALLANSTAVTSTAAYFIVSTTTYAEGAWAASDILTAPAVSNWGSAPWSGFQVDSPGWEITPAMKLSEVTADSLGTVDMILREIEVTAKAAPFGPTAAQVLSSMAAAAEYGTSLAAAGTELVVTSGTSPKLITVTVFNAALVDADLAWSAVKKRIGQCTWTATKTVADPLFSIGIS